MRVGVRVRVRVRVGVRVRVRVRVWVRVRVRAPLYHTTTPPDHPCVTPPVRV